MIFEIEHEGRRYTIGPDDPRNWVLRRHEWRDVNKKDGTTEHAEVATLLGYFAGPEGAISRLATTELAETGAVTRLEAIQGELRGLRESLVRSVRL